MEYAYVKKLKERVMYVWPSPYSICTDLSRLPSRTEEFEILMKGYQSPPVVDALTKVSELTKQVKQYQSVFGDASPKDVQAMATQLQAKEDELRKLRLQVQQRDQVGYRLLQFIISSDVVSYTRPKRHSTQSWKHCRRHGNGWTSRSRTRYLILPLWRRKRTN